MSFLRNDIPKQCPGQTQPGGTVFVGRAVVLMVVVVFFVVVGLTGLPGFAHS